ncbi:hypothetical protein [Frankia sp. AgB32]|uniref:hypothetical protein n=1 Tax=Frankia sp. AgB32 TaxID=631119 RepID=UPI00200BC481|nr:hypothetical protein [Frankia sp. AgB32]MCK9896343.1 hypothetical protein [Frankia sp. AgB32]
MRILFDAVVWTSYGQFYLRSGDDGSGPEMIAAFAGQSNGLCGAGCPGELFLMIGPHTVEVPMRIEAHDEPPPADDSWEDVAEVSFTPASPELWLASCMGEGYEVADLPAVGVYRARYSAAGMDAARIAEAEQVDFDEVAEPVDRYLLQLWPAPPAPDRVIRQTNDSAAYHHDWARALPPPPTAAQKAAETEAVRQAELAAQEGRERAAVREEEQRWGGRLPTPRLREVGGYAIPLARMDRDLLDQIAGATPQVQRAIARWAARRAYAHAGLDQVDWVAPALDALDAGRPLPAPFDGPARVWDRFAQDGRIALTEATMLDGGPMFMGISRQAVAIPTLFHATEADPLLAAAAALHIAADTFGGDHRGLLDEVRAVFFPDLTGK